MLGGAGRMLLLSSVANRPNKSFTVHLNKKNLIEALKKNLVGSTDRNVSMHCVRIQSFPEMRMRF